MKNSKLAGPGQDTQQLYWTLTDHQGSVRDVLWENTGGQQTAKFEYDAFGTPHLAGASELLALPANLYAAREYDSETGLYYNRARYYDPTAGRFLSEDPLGYAAGDTNLYRYAFNSPTHFTDPSGNFAISGGLFVAGLLYYASTQFNAAADEFDAAGEFHSLSIGETTQADVDRYNQHIQNAQGHITRGAISGAVGIAGAASPFLGAVFGGTSLFVAEGALSGGVFGSLHAYASGASSSQVAQQASTQALVGAFLGPIFGHGARYAAPFLGRAAGAAGHKLLAGASRIAPKATQNALVGSTLFVSGLRLGLQSSRALSNYSFKTYVELAGMEFLVLQKELFDGYEETIRLQG